MYTGIYWPNDYPMSERYDPEFSGIWLRYDLTKSHNNAAGLEGPSYCVRLLVFNYEDCI